MPDLADTDQHWPVDSSRDLHRDDWVVALRSDLVRRPGAEDEAPFRRLVLEHPGAAVVLAVDDQERVLCLWQYRHAAGRRFVEIPAGLMDGDAGEDPLEVARRELREEAQLAAQEWTHLASTYSSPGISAEVAHLFLARDLSRQGRGDFELHHEEADMVSDWVPFDDLLGAVLDGRVQDAPVIIAVLTAHTRGLAGSSRQQDRQQVIGGVS